jgi:hypothetical protein
MAGPMRPTHPRIRSGLPDPSTRGCLRDREAQVVRGMDAVEPIPFRPGQGAEEDVGHHGPGRGLVMGDGLPQTLRLLTFVGRLAGQEPRRCRDPLGDQARFEELPLLFRVDPPRGVVRRRGGEVHHPAHDGRQVAADL